MSSEPWRDPERYKIGKLVKCHECKKECRKNHWGKWCYDCNVERIERISKSFDDIARGKK